MTGHVPQPAPSDSAPLASTSVDARPLREQRRHVASVLGRNRSSDRYDCAGRPRAVGIRGRRTQARRSTVVVAMKPTQARPGRPLLPPPRPHRRCQKPWEAELVRLARCERCGSTLSDPVSVERGLGPECWAKARTIRP
jgi:hypothetical protein